MTTMLHCDGAVCSLAQAPSLAFRPRRCGRGGATGARNRSSKRSIACTWRQSSPAAAATRDRPRGPGAIRKAAIRVACHRSAACRQRPRLRDRNGGRHVARVRNRRGCRQRAAVLGEPAALRTQAFVFTPEDLAWELGSGRATLVVDPAPLFDRAVSATLDSLAAARPAEKLALSAA
jgi:hypothetical protein